MEDSIELNAEYDDLVSDLAELKAFLSYLDLTEKDIADAKQVVWQCLLGDEDRDVPAVLTVISALNSYNY
jgi:hypothetical protein